VITFSVVIIVLLDPISTQRTELTYIYNSI